MTDMATDEIGGQRISRLEDIESIVDLKHRYCAACDDGYDAAAIAALFTSDGVWDGRPTYPKLEGRAEIERFFERASERVPFARHHVLNPRISLIGRSAARGEWMLLQPLTDAEVGPQWLIADYQDSYEKVDGTWLIRTSKVIVRSLSSYEQGWSPGQTAVRERAADRQAIVDNVIAYSLAVDSMDLGALAELLTDDFAADFGPTPDLKANGRDSFIAWMSRYWRFRRTHHQLGPSRVEIDGDSATSTTQVSAWQELPDGSEALAYAQFLDAHRRVAGEWKMSSRRCVLTGNNPLYSTELNRLHRAPAPDAGDSPAS